MRTLSKVAGLVLLTAISACDPEIVREEIELPALRASDIFNPDSLLIFIPAVSADQEKLAADYESRGESNIKNNPDMGLYQLKRSLSLAPTRDRYMKLGGAYLESGNYREANRVYSFLANRMYFTNSEGKYDDTLLLGKPDEETYYRLMLSEILDHGEIWGESFWMAEDAGLDMGKIRDRLLSDPLFPYKENSLAVQNLRVQFMSPEEIEAYKKTPEAFAYFLLDFKDSSEVFEIREEKLSQFNYRNETSWDEMGRPGADHLNIYFTREKQDDPDTWFRYDPKYRYKLNQDVTVVVYAIDSSATACPPEMRHIFYELVTYDSKGKYIDHTLIAWQNGEQVCEVSVKKDRLNAYTFKRSWEKPYDKNDFDNSVKGKEATGQSELKIAPNGTIDGKFYTANVP